MTIPTIDQLNYIEIRLTALESARKEPMPTYGHTDSSFSASAKWLSDAAVETLSDGERIASAFLAGYCAMLALQPFTHDSPTESAFESVLRNGTTLLNLSDADLIIGRLLLHWEQRWWLLRENSQPPPIENVGEAIAWAQRVRKAALRLRANG